MKKSFWIRMAMLISAFLLQITCVSISAAKGNKKLKERNERVLENKGRLAGVDFTHCGFCSKSMEKKLDMNYGYNRERCLLCNEKAIKDEVMQQCLDCQNLVCMGCIDFLKKKVPTWERNPVD